MNSLLPCLLAASLAVGMISGCETVSVPEGTEVWACRDYLDEGGVLVALIGNDTDRTGTVEVWGVDPQPAGFMVSGFNRIWIWPRPEYGGPDFMFQIWPNGTGRYFTLPDDLGEDHDAPDIKPTQIYQCSPR